MNFNRHEYKIAAHFLPALINDDFTGLEDGDDRAITEFMGMVYDHHGLGHWGTVPDESTNVRICDVTELLENCATVFYCTPKGA